MKNRHYNMLILDLDGTILDDQKKIPEQNKVAVKKLIDSGIKVIVCSGRIFKGARYYAKELGVKDPVIACNGALIRTMPDNKLLFLNTLRDEESRKVIEICKANNIYLHAYIGEVMVTEQLKYTSLIYSERNKELDDEDRIDIRVVRDLGEYFEQQGVPVSKFVIISDHSTYLKKVREIICKINSIEIASSSFDNFEVMNKGVSKGIAIEFLCNYFKIPISQTVAIGDNENDINMLKTVGFAIAMGNAVPELKQIAHYITDTNENYGVAKAIEWLLETQS